MIWVKLCPPKMCIEVLSPHTCEYGLIRNSVFRWNQDGVRSLVWAPLQWDWCLSKQDNLETDTQEEEKVMWRHRGKMAVEDGGRDLRDAVWSIRKPEEAREDSSPRTFRGSSAPLTTWFRTLSFRSFRRIISVFLGHPSLRYAVRTATGN